MTKPSLELENRAAQLCSLLTLVHGAGCNAFNQLYEKDRDNILWLASSLADEMRDMINNDGGGVQ